MFRMNGDNVWNTWRRHEPIRKKERLHVNLFKLMYLNLTQVLPSQTWETNRKKRKIEEKCEAHYNPIRVQNKKKDCVKLVIYYFYMVIYSTIRFKYLRRCCGIIWRYRCSHKNIFRCYKQMGLKKRMAMKEYFLLFFLSTRV